MTSIQSCYVLILLGCALALSGRVLALSGCVLALSGRVLVLSGRVPALSGGCLGDLHGNWIANNDTAHFYDHCWLS